MFSQKWVETGDIFAVYADLWRQYADRGISDVLDHDDKENALTSDFQHQHYFDVGADALDIIVQALVGARRPPPRAILDFPSGSGRVTRHLRAMFPDAKIGACDLYQEHIAFCATHFRAIPFLSEENLDALNIGEWDLIFCGSLLTHLPERLFWPTVRFIVDSLSPTGIAIVTLEGRQALDIQDRKWKFVEDDLFDIARRQYHARGFGFVDYNAAIRSNLFHKQESYGITLVKPSWLMAGLEMMSDIRIMGFAERRWDDHQDVVVFGKPGVND